MRSGFRHDAEIVNPAIPTRNHNHYSRKDGPARLPEMRICIVLVHASAILSSTIATQGSTANTGRSLQQRTDQKGKDAFVPPVSYGLSPPPHVAPALAADGPINANKFMLRQHESISGWSQ